MKKIFAAVMVLAATAFLFSCNRNDQFSTANSSTNIPGVSSGLYRITLYFDNSKNETADFADYRFEFAAGGQLKATSVNTNTTVTGTWSESNNRFTIALASDPLTKLNHKWLVSEKNNLGIKLLDDDTAKEERLEFTRQ